MSDQYTATVTPKGKKFLHQCFNPEGVKIAQRVSAKTYKFAVVTYTDKAIHMKYLEDGLKYNEAQAIKQPLYEKSYRDRAEYYRQEIQDFPGRPIEYRVSGWSNTGKFTTYGSMVIHSFVHVSQI